MSGNLLDIRESAPGSSRCTKTGKKRGGGKCSEGKKKEKKKGMDHHGFYLPLTTTTELY